MTRKRYVRLLMAKGYSRNAANSCAQEIAAEGGSYQQEYDDLEEVLRKFDDLADMRAAMQRFSQAIAEAIPGVVAAATRVVEALNAGLLAFGEAFRARMVKEKEPEA